MKALKVLIAEKDSKVAKALSSILIKNHKHVEFFYSTSFRDSFRMIGAGEIDVAFIDSHLEENTTRTLVHGIAENKHSSKIFLLSTLSDLEEATEMAKQGAANVIVKNDLFKLSSTDREKQVSSILKYDDIVVLFDESDELYTVCLN